MPIYEYRCEACGHQEEHLQKVSEPPIAQCPACRQPAYRKLLSAAGFQLKGSGWYATDFKGGKKPAEKPAEKAAAKPEAKTETKSEPKADPKSSKAEAVSN